MSPLIMLRVIQVTAVTNLVLFAVVLSTCRFAPKLRAGNRLMHANWYKRFYRYHSYLWWLFLPSITVHAVFAYIYVNL